MFIQKKKKELLKGELLWTPNNKFKVVFLLVGKTTEVVIGVGFVTLFLLSYTINRIKL